MSLNKNLFAVFIFSIAMAYLESAVVVYLRYLYYPMGFIFPIKMIPNQTLFIELGREAVTIIMLLAIALLSSKLTRQRIFFFFFAFGVWDIFYYIWLKIFINWPQTLLADDLLFLIPVPWIAPIVAPILISVLFITISIMALKKIEKGKQVEISKTNAAIILVGVLLILISFMWNYRERLISTSPVEFFWMVFIIGLLLMIAGGINIILQKGEEKKSRKAAEPQD
ncbi:MAG TPA: hypothetical protein PKD67_08910 [Ignavibacteriaceae bacterium]|nr:hypothetical protein [Ignavibacteriaceae bacterium]